MHFKELSERDKAKDFRTLGWIHAQLKSHYGAIAYLTISNAAEAFLEVWTAILCKTVIDAAIGGESGVLIRNSVFLLLALAGPIVLNLVFQIVEEKVVNRLRIAFQNAVLFHFFAAPYERGAEYHSEEVLNRMFSDAEIVSEGIVDLIPTIIYFAVQFIGALAALLYLDPRFTLLFLIASAALGILLYSLRRRFKDLHKDVQGAEDQLRSFLQDVLSNSLVIRVFGAHEPVMKKTGDYQDQYYKARMKRTIFNHAAGSGMSVIFTLGYWAAMLWGSWGIFAGWFSYGTLVAMMELVGKIQMPMSGITSLFAETFKVLASAERIMELEDGGKSDRSSVILIDKQEDGSEDGSATVPDAADAYRTFGGIEIRDVSFSYGEHDVLKCVDLVIRKGDFVSLTGMSGGGKSTLFLLLLGAYKPSEGSISFLREDGRSMEDTVAHSMITYVPQENHLFTGNICDNITLFEEKPDEERVQAALRTACADSFVNELPDGIHSELKEKGHGLSEGQMQRLAIARAIYSGAAILLMDEATSALDADTEAQVLDNIAKLKNKTCLMVTHREKALQYCSRHLVMEGERIREITEEGVE